MRIHLRSDQPPFTCERRPFDLETEGHPGQCWHLRRDVSGDLVRFRRGKSSGSTRTSPHSSSLAYRMFPRVCPRPRCRTGLSDRPRNLGLRAGPRPHHRQADQHHTSRTGFGHRGPGGGARRAVAFRPAGSGGAQLRPAAVGGHVTGSPDRQARTESFLSGWPGAADPTWRRRWQIGFTSSESACRVTPKPSAARVTVKPRGSRHCRFTIPPGCGGLCMAMISLACGSRTRSRWPNSHFAHSLLASFSQGAASPLLRWAELYHRSGARGSTS